MSKPKSSKRKQAYMLWEKSGRTAQLKDIAAKLGVSASLVSKWKSIDNWEAKTLPFAGAPIGNKNATGNRGGKGAPERNTYAEKHGAYSKIYRDTLSEDELQLIESIDLDTDPVLLWQLRDLTVKVYRLQRRIKALDMERGGLIMEGKVSERTPKGEKTVTYTSSVFNRLMVLEAEHNRTHGRITKVLEVIIRTRSEEIKLEMERQRLELLKRKVMGYIEIDPDDSGHDGDTIDSKPRGS